MRTVKGMISLLLWVGAGYGSMCLIFLSPDPAKWGIAARWMLAVWTLIWIGATMSYLNGEDEKKKTGNR
jgi:hypothetical protein